jgi:hypothetical protein
VIDEYTFFLASTQLPGGGEMSKRDLAPIQPSGTRSIHRDTCDSAIATNNNRVSGHHYHKLSPHQRARRPLPAACELVSMLSPIVQLQASFLGSMLSTAVSSADAAAILAILPHHNKPLGFLLLAVVHATVATTAAIPTGEPPACTI